MTDLSSTREDGTEINLLEALAESYSRDSLSFRVENYALEYFKNLRADYFTYSEVFEDVQDGGSVDIVLRGEDVDQLLSLVSQVNSEVRCRIKFFEGVEFDDLTGEERTVRTLNRDDPDTVADGDFVRVDPDIVDDGVELQDRIIGGDARGQARVGGETSPVASFIMDQETNYLLRLMNTSNDVGNIGFVGDVVSVNEYLVNDRLP